MVADHSSNVQNARSSVNISLLNCTQESLVAKGCLEIKIVFYEDRKDW